MQGDSSTAAEACPRCRGTGVVQRVIEDKPTPTPRAQPSQARPWSNGPLFPDLFPDPAQWCDCALGVERHAEQQARQAEERARKHAERAQAFRDGLPPEYRALTLSSYPRSLPQRRVLRELARWLKAIEVDNPVWLLLSGPYGVGKTALACSLAAHLIERGLVRDADHIVVPRLLRALHEAYNPSADDRVRPPSEATLLREAETVGLLILDEIGQHDTSDWAIQRVGQVIAERHDQRRLTILCTNFSVSTLALRLSDYVMTRVTHRLQVVDMHACPDLRQQPPGSEP